MAGSVDQDPARRPAPSSPIASISRSAEGSPSCCALEFQACGVVLFVGWRVGAERRGESGSSSGWRPRYCLGRWRRPPSWTVGFGTPHSQQHGDGEILRSQYEAIFLHSLESADIAASIAPSEIPEDC
jgi:hypothetical protein